MNDYELMNELQRRAVKITKEYINYIEHCSNAEDAINVTEDFISVLCWISDGFEVITKHKTD